MKKTLLLLLMVAFNAAVFSQADHHGSQDTAWKSAYRETAPIINSLVHTKLDARFDYDKAWMYGKVWITLKPHFYTTDSLTLDAKGMEIKKVALVKGNSQSELKYAYDSMQLRITLDKPYKGGEKYTVYIEYIAKPNEYTGRGSAAITDAKGLYFINPTGEDKDKPVQIWTQGETEATSVWCPTIDRPNQKTTQEIAMTVPAKFVTLSNGILASQKKNTDGTRTDTWKMNQPHAPYLFFMGVGDYAVVKDSYKGKEVSYYVEKEYAPVARKIFGNTPEMMKYFERILGIPYPWDKYAQIVGRDYVSGAMENTTATLHQESAQQDARELIDGNHWERVIAHELFHHWFGDLVTSESWSNLTINESFANYSETLWDEYKYGKDAGLAQHFSDMQGYLFSQSEAKDLVRFYYEDKEAMFDAVSYNKGGRILHMLRNFVGDSAFFKSLNLFLKTHAFKAAEAHQLRLAFEEVTGKDLNWFWNQWYFGAGHPKLTIDYLYNDADKQVKVVVKQTQTGQVFRLPVSIDLYNGSNKKRHDVWVENAVDTFTFSYTTKPDLVNFDGDKVLLAEKKDNKTLENFIHQYKHAGNYIDRREAIDFVARKQDDPKAVEFMKAAISDKYHGLRSYAISKVDLKKSAVKEAMEAPLADIAANDPKSTVRSTAITALATYRNDKYKPLFAKAIADSSYSVAGSALEALSIIDSTQALTEAKRLSAGKMKGRLMESITAMLIKSGDENAFDAIADAFDKMAISQAKFNLLQPFSEMVGKTTDTDKTKRGVDLIVDFRKAIPEQYGLTPVINNFLKNIITAKERIKTAASDKSALQTQIDYINGQIAGERKGF